MLSTPVAQVNATIVMTLQGHIQEHIGMMAEAMAQAEITANTTPEQQMMMQQKSTDDARDANTDTRSCKLVIIGELTEKYAQTIQPESNSDPLVEIRKQELAIKGAESQRRAQEFEQKQEFQEEKERKSTISRPTKN